MTTNYYCKYRMKDSILVGTSPHCDVQFNNPKIESFHAEIHWSKGQIISEFRPYLSIIGKRGNVFEEGDILSIDTLNLIPTRYFIMINEVKGVRINLDKFQKKTFIKPPDIEYKNFNSTIRFLKEYPSCSVIFKRIDLIPEERKTPLIFTIGPALVMSIASLLSGSLSAYNGYMQGREIKELVPMLLLPLVMILSVLIYQPLQRKYDKKKRIKLEKDRLQKIIFNLKKEEEKIKHYHLEYQHCNNKRFKSMEELSNLMFSSNLLTLKMPEHDDFLKFPLGKGCVNSRITFNNIPDEEDKEYYSKARALIEKWSVFPKEWIIIDLSSKKQFAIVGEYERWVNFILLQILLNYDRNQIELLFITSEDWLNKHRFLYGLSHTVLEGGKRGFATTQAQVTLLLNQNNKTKLLIIENSSLILDEIVKSHRCIYLLPNEEDIPWFCKAYLLSHGSKSILVEQDGKTELEFVDGCTDIKKIIEQVRLSRQDLNVDNQSLKKTILALYQCTRSEQLKIEERWANKKESLSVPIGTHENGEIFYIDLHEKAHGPHMIVGATTGAGKSEFILTLLLSLAINFSSDQVSFAIIDFKGGGLSESLKSHGTFLPHVAGVITNLDSQEMERVLVSFKNECHRRQKLFNKLKHQLNLTNVNIDIYQQLASQAQTFEPITHLFIIVDEFAELKTSAPEFIKEMISLARIGRSLGVHLILATQKPSGVIDGEIWSNTRCKICMKVQEKQDSLDMIHSDKAFYLRNPGEFYFKVDHEEYRANCAWSNAPYSECDKNQSVELIDEIGGVIKKTEESFTNLITELSIIIDEILTLKKVPVQPIWLSPLQEITKIPEMKNDLILGKVDNYHEKTQSWMVHSFSNNGHGVIYSMNMEEKKKMLTTLLFALLKTNEEADIIVIDSISCLSKLVGITVIHDENEIDLFLKELLINFSKRKKKMIIIFSHYPKFSEIHQSFIHEMGQLLRDGPLYDLYFFLFTTTANSIPYRWISLLQQRYCLATNQKNEINTIFEANLHRNKIKEDFGIVSGQPPLLFRMLNIPKEEIDKVILSQEKDNDTNCSLC